MGLLGVGVISADTADTTVTIKERTPISFKLRNARQSRPYLDEIGFEPGNAQIRLVSVELPAGDGADLQSKHDDGRGTPSCWRFSIQ